MKELFYQRPGGSLKKHLKRLREPALTVLVIAAAACVSQPTVTPGEVAEPGPTPTNVPTVSAESTAVPLPVVEPSATPTPTPSSSPAIPSYWSPPTDYYGEPVYGGTLRINYEDPLEHANVWGARTGVALRYRVPTGATLVMEDPYAPGAPVIPDLAESWEVHDGSKAVTFHFREGTTWHSGDAFVCEDARFSFETMLTEEGITASYMKHLLSDVAPEGMTCLDDMTLEISFASPHGNSSPSLLESGCPGFRQGLVSGGK